MPHGPRPAPGGPRGVPHGFKPWPTPRAKWERTPWWVIWRLWRLKWRRPKWDEWGYRWGYSYATDRQFARIALEEAFGPRNSTTRSSR